MRIFIDKANVMPLVSMVLSFLCLALVVFTLFYYRGISGQERYLPNQTTITSPEGLNIE